MKLGKLKKVDIKSIWKHEARDFSVWLSKEDNLSALGEELGIEIVLREREASVGSFSADILGHEENTDNVVIIENQFNQTDHDHLGKLITYASGFDAKYIIWIFERIREEHRQAITWLNERTSDDTYFFAVQMELWQIGDSVPAPRFNVVSRPNDWAKVIKSSAKGNQALTETKVKQLQYWEAYVEYCANNQTSIRPQKVYPQHWSNISIGSSLCHICMTVNTNDNYIGVEFYISDNKDLYNHLEANKKEIEAKLNVSLDWQMLPHAKASRIKLIKSGFDLKNESCWQEYISWMVSTAQDFKKVFTPYVKSF